MVAKIDCITFVDSSGTFKYFLGLFSGALRDATNSYVSVFMLIGGVQLGTMFLYLTAWLVRRRRTEKNTDE